MKVRKVRKSEEQVTEKVGMERRRRGRKEGMEMERKETEGKERKRNAKKRS